MEEKFKIPYMNLVGASFASTAMIGVAMIVLLNDLKLGNLGIGLSLVVAFGVIFFNNYLMVRNLTTQT